MEAAPGFEPGNSGFADRRLPTWLSRPSQIFMVNYMRKPKKGQEVELRKWLLYLLLSSTPVVL